MMTSKAEYLKRYMSNESVPKKKKKEKKPVVDKSRVKILDDDVDFKALLPQNINNTLDDDIGDDNPAVAEFVDERPQHVKELERFRQSKQWKLVSMKPDSGNDGHQSNECSTVRRSADPAQRSGTDRHGAGVDQHRRRHDSDSDLDVRRQPTHDSDSDLSPVRVKGRSNQRHDSSSSSDLSPVRVGGHRHSTDSDLSPKRAANQSSRRHDSDSDLSPVRVSRRTDYDVLPKTAGKRSRQRHDSDADLSPPRARDQSTSKRARHDSDLSPPRTKNLSCRQDSDLSPVRRDRNSDHSALQSVHRQRRSSSPQKLQQTKTLSGATAGLQLAADMRKESQELKRRENTSFNKISDEMLGKNAETVVRDKATGRRRDLDAERAKEAETDAAKAVTTAKYDAWNKGLRQKEMQEERIVDALHEADKPLARYSDDADLDARLREQEREGDTMLAYIRKKKEKGVTKSKPVYRGPEPPPNRFGIRPGYRWDGVDRSNGFEKLYFTKLSEKKAMKDIAYKWSVENM